MRTGMKRSDRAGRRTWLVALLTMTLLTGCGGTAVSPSPSLIPPGPTLMPSGAAPPATPSLAPIPSVTPGPTSIAGPVESSGPSTGEAPAGLAISAVARAAADPTLARSAASNIDAFGLALYRQLLSDPSLGLAGHNAVISPTSIALALGMALPGAKGTTAAQMASVLQTSGWSAFGPGLNALEQALVSRDAAWTDDAGDHALALRIANAAYGQAGWTIEQPYLDAIKVAFGAGLRLADFAADPDSARAAINAWVKEQTAGRIPQLLGPVDITTLTRLVLVNAMYLKAGWEVPFVEQGTGPASFTRLDGSTVQVPTMRGMGGEGGGMRPIPYASGNGWQAVELRYRGGPGSTNTPLAMTLLLPRDLAAFGQHLSAAQLDRITGALEAQRATFDTFISCPWAKAGDYPSCYPYALQLYLPRFSIETRADLKAPLQALGMSLAFDPVAADFTGIHVPQGETDRLFVSKVVHQANIDVDERGTEAAAATAVIGGTGGGPGAAREITLRLDHPFVFFVRDLATGAVLFMGQVTDPSA